MRLRRLISLLVLAAYVGLVPAGEFLHHIAHIVQQTTDDSSLGSASLTPVGFPQSRALSSATRECEIATNLNHVLHDRILPSPVDFLTPIRDAQIVVPALTAGEILSLQIFEQRNRGPPAFSQDHIS